MKLNTPLYAPEDSGKGSGGGDADLMAAITASDKQPEVNAKVAQKGLKKDGQSTDKGGSAILDELNLAKAADGTVQKKVAPGKDPVVTPVEGDDDLEDRFPKFDDTGITSAKIRQDYKTRNEQRDAILLETRTARAEAKKAKEDLAAALAKAGTVTPASIDEDPRYKEVVKTSTEREQLIERLSLEQSPKFRAKYDEKILKGVKQIIPFLRQIKDAETQASVVNSMDALRGMAAGEEYDGEFSAKLAQILDNENIPSYVKAPLVAKMEAIREMNNERAAALAEWQETRKEIGNSDVQDRKVKASTAVQTFRGIRTKFEADRSEKIAAMRANPTVFQYDESVKPLVTIGEQLLQKSVETGEISEQLMQFVSAGAETPYYMAMNDRFIQIIKAQAKELATYKAKEKTVDDLDPGHGSRQVVRKITAGAGAPDPKKWPKGSGILQTMQEMATEE